MKTLTESECGLVAGGLRKTGMRRARRRASALGRRHSAKSAKVGTDLLKGPPHSGGGFSGGGGSSGGGSSGFGSSGGGGSSGFGSSGGGGSSGFGSSGGDGSSGYGYSGTGSSGDTALGSSVVTSDGKDVQLIYQANVNNDGPTTPVTQALSNALDSTLNYDPSVSSLQISRTYGNDSNQPYPDHSDGLAVDIDEINGVVVSGTGEGATLADGLENAAMADPDVRFVEGPEGNFVRSAIGGAWERDTKVGAETNHVHISAFAGTGN